MTNGKRTSLAFSLVLGAIALAALASPASARWYGNGQWHDDERWEGRGYNNGQNNNYNRYYNGYSYRTPPVIYGTPYNYGYSPPPLIYDNTPTFTFRFGG